MEIPPPIRKNSRKISWEEAGRAKEEKTTKHIKIIKAGPAEMEPGADRAGSDERRPNTHKNNAHRSVPAPTLKGFRPVQPVKMGMIR